MAWSEYQHFNSLFCSRSAVYHLLFVLLLGNRVSVWSVYHPYLREPGEMGLWNSSVIRGVNYGEDYSFPEIMVSAKFLSLRKPKTAALPSSPLLLCLCFAVVESSNLLTCPSLSPLNFGHRQFLDINTSIFGICQMFILYFIKSSQLEFVLQVHINFFLFWFCFIRFVVIYLYFLILKKRMRENKNN